MKKRITGRKEAKLPKEKAVSRRDFFRAGAAAGAAVLPAGALAQEAAQRVQWNY